MKKISNKYIFILCMLVIVSACKKGLDYKDTNSISPDNVWKDPNMIKAYLNDIYGRTMPFWDFSSGNNTDEAFNRPGSMPGFLRGIISVDQTNLSMDYSIIDKCNFFLDQLAVVPASVLDPALNGRYQGEAKFWRTWAYWNMVNAVGGVPLILHTQNALDLNSLKVPRAKTSECIAQMMKDLDSAASLLPATYTGADYGRITKVAALGLKGKILMWWASPLFNPTNDQTRWQKAYEATKAAVDAANAAGYGLVSNYRSIWYNRNKEQIMVRQFDFNKGSYPGFNNVRPEPFTNNATDNNMPQLSLLLAYPKRDGSFLQLSDTVNSDQFLTDFYTNRDDRFYATIYCGGTVYPTPDKFINETAPTTYWMAWAMKNGAIKSDSSVNQAVYPYSASTSSNFSSFRYRRIDTTQTGSQSVAGVSGNVMWWVPMRYAELYLNYGECANEVGGKTSEVLQVLKDIRKRAGIIAGADGNYGITATTQSDFRTAIMKERQVELAYENFRWGDLRRWKRYDVLNAQGTRKLLILTLKQGAPLPGKTQNIMDPAVRANFKFTYVSNLDGSGYSYNIDLNHWFTALSPANISTAPEQLPQNKEWGGTFDPLQ